MDNLIPSHYFIHYLTEYYHILTVKKNNRILNCMLVMLPAFSYVIYFLTIFLAPYIMYFTYVKTEQVNIVKIMGITILSIICASGFVMFIITPIAVYFINYYYNKTKYEFLRNDMENNFMKIHSENFFKWYESYSQETLNTLSQISLCENHFITRDIESGDYCTTLSNQQILDSIKIIDKI
ncbi:hypothetical protein Catovirus_1_262 [Catovirus CTV1]|uniref:Uncharacterized protein n=1 Tax=Catovirus CTV1 TaxID=1977631 RepID=A0A1V0S927_9VIRU|nr:hypothetical protein Catovirus_1_262 [Catovirus CTV1]